MKPTRQISARITDEQYDAIKKEELETDKNFSEILRELLDSALFMKKKMDQAKNDPAAFVEFIKKMNSKMNEKNFFEWLKTLSDSKLTGLIEGAKIEKENR